MEVFYVAIFTATLYFTLAIDNAALPTLNKQIPVSIIDGPGALQVGQMSLFGQYVYHLTTSSGIFNKVYDVSFKNPTEIAAGFFFGPLYYSSNQSTTYRGKLVLETSQAAEKAFIRGLTPLNYFKAFINSIEDPLRKRGIMNASNILSIAKKYHLELVKAIDALGPLDSPLAHLYALVVADTSFMRSFDPTTSENFVYEMQKFIDEWNQT